MRSGRRRICSRSGIGRILRPDVIGAQNDMNLVLLGQDSPIESGGRGTKGDGVNKYKTCGVKLINNL